MAGRLLFILLLTINEKSVQAKTFSCVKATESREKCEITNVLIEDTSIELTPSNNPYNLYTTKWLTVLNSTIEVIPPISSRYALNLEYLNCVGCGLTEITKHSFVSLGNLIALNISFGSYSKLKNNLFSQLSSLTHLNVSHGAIAEIDDTAFFNLRKLDVLDLQHNNISKVTPNMFATLESITFLDLSYNHIQILNDGLFVNNGNLKFLYVEYNDINKIDGRLSNAQSVISEVVLSYNELWTVDTASFNAAKVWVDHNRLKQLRIAETVQLLNANENDIKHGICEGSSSQISVLSLTNNSLTELSCISSLTQLTKLYLRNNNLEKLNQSSFAALTELITLDLKSTNIGKLEYGMFSHQNNLKFVDLSYNHIGNIALEIFLAARGLKALYIDGNNITEFSYNDLKTAFTSFQTIGIGDNNFNCTFLAQAIKQLNSYDIKATVTYGNKVTNSHNVNGIGCHDNEEIATPSWIPTIENKTGDAEVNIRLDAIIQQVQKMSQIIAENDEKSKKLSEDIGAVKQKNFELNSDILTNKADILKIKLTKNNNSTTSSNTMWEQINQLNITLEKQQINNRVQTQEMNELKFEIEKNGHKTSDIISKMEKLMKVVTLLQSSSSDNKKGDSNSNFDLIKNVNIILITLIGAFCIYKGYKFVKNDLPRIKRYNTANTLHTNIEMDNSSGK